MGNTDIVRAVEDSVVELGRLFMNAPTRFFTENDLVCSFVAAVQDRLATINADM